MVFFLIACNYQNPHSVADLEGASGAHQPYISVYKKPPHGSIKRRGGLRTSQNGCSGYVAAICENNTNALIQNVEIYQSHDQFCLSSNKLLAFLTTHITHFYKRLKEHIG